MSSLSDFIQMYGDKIQMTTEECLSYEHSGKKSFERCKYFPAYYEVPKRTNRCTAGNTVGYYIRSDDPFCVFEFTGESGWVHDNCATPTIQVHLNLNQDKIKMKCAECSKQTTYKNLVPTSSDRGPAPGHLEYRSLPSFT